MNYYHMWFDLIDTRKDIEFSKAVDAYLGHLKSQGRIEGWKLTRRKFGFGPEAIGEFHCSVWTKDLAQLDQAFSLVATRAGEVERLHHPVYSAVTLQVSPVSRLPRPRARATHADHVDDYRSIPPLRSAPRTN
jgi:hypothetical protein